LTVLTKAGIDGAAWRTKPTWGQFLRSQAEAIMAAGFFTVDLLNGADHADPAGDSVSYRQGTLWLSPDELAEMIDEMLARGVGRTLRDHWVKAKTATAALGWVTPLVTRSVATAFSQLIISGHRRAEACAAGAHRASRSITSGRSCTWTCSD
jgi:hypothetical protein